MVRKVIAILVVLTLSLFAFTGCGGGGKGIEGTWILTEEIQADGTKVSKNDLEELGVSEIYEIKGSSAIYKAELASMSKPVTIEFEIEDLGHNTYRIRLPGSNVTFATAVLDGNTLTSYVGEGEEASQMIYKRQ